MYNMVACGAMMNFFFKPNLHICHLRGEFVLRGGCMKKRKKKRILIGTAFMPHELPHSLISLNFFDYVSICRVFFSYAEKLFFFFICWMTIATKMTMRHSTTYVNERNLIAFVDIDETYHIAHMVPLRVYTHSSRLAFVILRQYCWKSIESEEFRVINGFFKMFFFIFMFKK